MRARVKMTADHNPHVKGQVFNTSRDYADFLIGEDVAKEVKVDAPNREHVTITKDDVGTLDLSPEGGE